MDGPRLEAMTDMVMLQAPSEAQHTLAKAIVSCHEIRKQICVGCFATWLTGAQHVVEPAVVLRTFRAGKIVLLQPGLGCCNHLAE